MHSWRNSAATRWPRSSATTAVTCSPSVSSTRGGMAGKLMTMADAIRQFVPDGSTVAIGTALEPLIPFAAGHEMIRQGRRDLDLVGPISDALFEIGRAHV